MRNRLVLLALAAVLAAGCQTTPPAAEPPPPAPTSIAYRPSQVAPNAWTTPQRPQGPTLRRPTSGRRIDAGDLPLSLASSPSDPRFEQVGDPFERRLEPGDLATAGPWEVISTAVTTYEIGGDLQTGENGVDTWINRLRVSFEKPMDYFGRFGTYVQYTNRQYSFSGSNSFFAGTNDPFGSIHRLGLGVNLFQPVHTSWAIFASFDVGFSAEDGADLGDGFGWSATLGGGYRVSRQLDVGGGIFVSQPFADDLFIIGGPQFDWRPSEQWRVALQGTLLDVAWMPSRVWEFGGAGGFLGARFRLRNDTAAAGGIVTASRFPIYGRVRYRGNPNLDLEARAGVDVLRWFTIEDAGGNNARTFDADPGLFFSIRAIWQL